MSFIAHRCRRCGHVDNWHGQMYTFGGCNDLDADPTPEVITTYAGQFKPVEAVIPPGATWNEGCTARVKTCTCDACQALYAEVSS